MDRLKLACGIFFCALLAFACGKAANTSNVANTNKPINAPDAVPAVTIDQAATSKELYAKNCMICHKENGTGGKVTVDGKNLEPDDLTTAKMKARADDKLAHQISEGAPDDGMPAFKDKLSPDQIKQVVAHLRVLQGS